MPDASLPQVGVTLKGHTNAKAPRGISSSTRAELQFSFFPSSILLSSFTALQERPNVCSQKTSCTLISTAFCFQET